MEFTQFTAKHNLRIVRCALKSAVESAAGWNVTDSNGKPLTGREIQHRQEEMVYPGERTFGARLPRIKRPRPVFRDSAEAKRNEEEGFPIGTVRHAEHGPLVPVKDWREYPTYGWSIALTIGAGQPSAHNTIEQDFYQGIANAVVVEPGGILPWQRDDYAVYAKVPEIGGLLYCIASDCQDIEQVRSFEEWADEFGMDRDSRSAERIYNATREEAQRWRNLLGLGRYGELLACVEDGTEEGAGDPSDPGHPDNPRSSYDI